MGNSCKNSARTTTDSDYYVNANAEDITHTALMPGGGQGTGTFPPAPLITATVPGGKPFQYPFLPASGQTTERYSHYGPRKSTPTAATTRTTTGSDSGSGQGPDSAASHVTAPAGSNQLGATADEEVTVASAKTTESVEVKPCTEVGPATVGHLVGEAAPNIQPTTADREPQPKEAAAEEAARSTYRMGTDFAVKQEVTEVAAEKEEERPERKGAEYVKDVTSPETRAMIDHGNVPFEEQVITGTYRLVNKYIPGMPGQGPIPLSYASGAFIPPNEAMAAETNAFGKPAEEQQGGVGGACAGSEPLMLQKCCPKLPKVECVPPDEKTMLDETIRTTPTLQSCSPTVPTVQCTTPSLRAPTQEPLQLQTCPTEQAPTAATRIKSTTTIKKTTKEETLPPEKPPLLKGYFDKAVEMFRGKKQVEHECLDTSEGESIKYFPVENSPSRCDKTVKYLPVGNPPPSQRADTRKPMKLQVYQQEEVQEQTIPRAETVARKDEIIQTSDNEMKEAQVQTGDSLMPPQSMIATVVERAPQMDAMCQCPSCRTGAIPVVTARCSACPDCCAQHLHVAPAPPPTALFTNAQTRQSDQPVLDEQRVSQKIRECCANCGRVKDFLKC